MSYENSKALTATAPLLEALSSEPSTTGVGQCLVVSSHPVRRELLHGAADDGGWRPLVCGDSAAARQILSRTMTPLVVIDLYDDDGRRTEGLRRIAEELAIQPGYLLAIVGSEIDPLDEIWARQLGAWLYLPGIDDPSDDVSQRADCMRSFTNIFAEARIAVEQVPSLSAVPAAPAARRNAARSPAGRAAKRNSVSDRSAHIQPGKLRNADPKNSGPPRKRR
jgi:hypothetical protein